MPKLNACTMHTQTPLLQVIEGRGLAVRQIAWHRSIAGQTPTGRIQRQAFDAWARPTATWDPRQSARPAQAPTQAPNIATLFSLCGTPLLIDSVDAGWHVSLYGDAGQCLESWDGRGSHWQNELDQSLRPTAVHEQILGQAFRTSERYAYADNSQQSASHNLCGRLIRTDDGAGSEYTQSYGIGGQVLQQTRRFLSALDLPDWPEQMPLRDAMLDPQAAATTGLSYDPTGQLLGQIDARGNQQNFRYGVSGQLQQCRLKPAGRPDQLLVHGIEYNAHYQVQSQANGNGVVNRSRFDPADGRLMELTTSRANAESLQHLLYHYDPVGNVLSIEDQAQPTRHFANQQIQAIDHYEYDSLYQLIKATGREAAGTTLHPQLRTLAPAPMDASRLLNYTQHYRYDEGGNLIQLRHEGSQSYIRDFEVDQTSNRALIKLEGRAPPDFAAEFDPCGNLQHLQPGQLMSWDGSNRLARITAVSRQDAEDDVEQYVYDHSGQRLRKITTASTRASSHSREVRYLPGLELRSDSATDEQLEVIVIQAGRCAVRCLHWLSGRPADIENDQLRYSIDDHLGSSTLELDGAARLISHEGYYPFGGTAWWAAHSVIEASYKVVRYSGKERDASGLYYYGVRYYAPWLMRWICPDPGREIDGLNLYTMVGNSPVTCIDIAGLTGIIPTYVNWIWLGSPIPDQLTHNIMDFMNLNPAFTPTLWVDNTSWQSGHGARLEMLPRRVRVRPVSEIFDGVDPRLHAAFERERSGPLRNYPAASDIARVAVLKNSGGLYLDADVQLAGALDSPLSTNTGVLIVEDDEGFGNAVIAAAPNSHLLDAAATRICEQYSSSANESWDTKRSFENSADIKKQNAARAAHIDKYTQELNSVSEAIARRPDAVRYEDLMKRACLKRIINEAAEIRGVDFVPPRRVDLTMEMTGPGMWLEVLGTQVDHSLFRKGQFKPINGDARAMTNRPPTLRRASL